MERTTPRAARGIAIALAILAMGGSGCARMRTYRAQDSPLPGTPLVDRARAKLRRGRDVAQAKPAPESRRADVAWSGEPNTAPARPRVATPARPAANTPAPALSLEKPPATAPSASPASPKAADPAVAKVRALVDEGRARLAGVAAYQVVVHGQEFVNGALLPAEDALLNIRRQPRAIRLEWPSGAHKGREVIYRADEPGNVMHVHSGPTVLPIPDMTLPTDSPLVMRHSRHPITEAGLDAVLDRLDESLKPFEAGDARGGALSYDGIRTPPEVGRPCHAITRASAEGYTWLVALDAQTGFPALVQELGPDGALIERYVFRDLVLDPPALADASAFDPSRRWGGGLGRLGRMAKGGAPDALAR